MAFITKSLTTFSRLAATKSRVGAVVAQRGYADGSNEMAFTFATPSECFYNNAKVKQVYNYKYSTSNKQYMMMMMSF